MKPRLGALILIAAMALLVAPPARPYAIAHTSSASFDPAVSPEEYRPAADGGRPGPGKPPLAFTIQILPLPPELGPATVDAVARAIEHWNAVPGSTARVTAARPGAGAAYDPDWFSRYLAEDGRDTIEFVTHDWHTLWDSGVIGKTIAHWGPDGRLLETDIFMNAEDFTWEVLPTEGAYPELAPFGVEDVESIVTHEAGHTFGIGHSQYPWAAMWGQAGYADTRFRHLAGDDHQAMRLLYPATSADLPPPSVWYVAQGPFGDGVCGMSFINLLSVTVYYSAELRRSHPLSSELDYCLFGSGFTAGLTGMDLSRLGTGLATVAGPRYIGPNFVRAGTMNAALIPAGTYDFTVTQDPGGTGTLAQGLVLNPAGNGLPLAVIQPAAEQTVAGAWIALDGSGSSDPDGSALTYRWSVEESPVGAAAVIADPAAARTSVWLPAAGMYAVRLTVNDGTLDGIADQVLLRAVSAPGGSGGRHRRGPLGCGLAPAGLAEGPGAEASGRGGGMGLVAVPLMTVWVLRRKRRVR
jgi:hypothetical protein